jgi:UDP-glucose 4-epimerase
MTAMAVQRVLVTGASGFIASHLTRRLVREGAEVAILTKYNSVIDNIRIVDVWNDIRVLEADIRNLDSLRQIAQFKPNIVFHFAAYNHVGDSFLHVSETLDSNIRGTANVLESYDGYDRFVYISTSEVYGRQDVVPFQEDMIPRPLSPYAVGKYAGELYCRIKLERSDNRVVVLRPFNAFGPYQSPRAVIAEMVLTCLAGKPVVSTEGIQTREFNFVENLVDGFILAAQRDEALGQIINLGCGKEIPIRDLIRKIHELTESDSELNIGKLPYRPTEIWRMCADNSRAKTLLNWEPRVDFEEGLKRTIAWFRAFQHEIDSPTSGVRRLSAFCLDG